MSKMELLSALEKEKSTKQKCKQYCGIPCSKYLTWGVAWVGG